MLVPGDTLAAVSLSWGGPATFPHRYEAGVAQLEREFGVRVVPSRNALRPADWLARNPQARADDLMESFADPSIAGIVCTIGGDDSIRLLRHLRSDVIRSNPKVFLGYSDATVTHFVCLAAGLVSFYGPTIMAGFGESGGLHRYTSDSVRRTLFSPATIGELTPGTQFTAEFQDWSKPELQEVPRVMQPAEGPRFLQGRGIVEGPLIGGCLEVLEFLRGTPAWPEPSRFEGAILFLETSEEAPPPAVVTRALRSYAAMGLLEKLNGIIFGRPGGVVPAERFEDYDQAILNVVRDEEGLEELAVVTALDFGHTDPMFVLPYGVRARIDIDGRKLSIEESAVSAGRKT